MDYTKQVKKIENSKNKTSIILKVTIAAICLLTALTMFLPLFKTYGKFTSSFIEIMKLTLPEFDFSNIGGLAITIYGYQFAFGVNEVSVNQPYKLIADAFLIVCYLLPLAVGLLLIPIKKLDKNKTYLIIKYFFMGILMISFGVLFMVYVSGSIESFRNMLEGKSPGYGFIIYESVAISKAVLPMLLQLLYILGGFCCFYLATNVGKPEIESKKKRK